MKEALRFAEKKIKTSESLLSGYVTLYLFKKLTLFLRQLNPKNNASGLLFIIIHSKYFPNSDWLKPHA